MGGSGGNGRWKVEVYADKVEGEKWKVVGEYEHAPKIRQNFCQDLETVREF